MSDILLNEQSEFENERIKLESENMKIMSEFKQMDKYNLKNKEKIHRLKKEKKRDIGVINVQKKEVQKVSGIKIKKPGQENNEKKEEKNKSIKR